MVGGSMKVNTEMIEKLAQARVLDLAFDGQTFELVDGCDGQFRLRATPEELVELGVELVLIGTARMKKN
jgi:hypothetical protein